MDPKLLSGDTYFKENPEKLLGEEKEERGRFGIAKVYVGNMDAALQQIDAADTSVLTIDINATPTETVITEDQPGVTQSEDDNIDTALNHVDKEIAEKQTTKVSRKRTYDDPPSRPEMYSFQETYEQTNRINPALPAIGENKRITDEELRAFVWYKENIRQPLSRKWYDLAGYRTMNADSEVDLKRWLKEQIVCYYDGELLPSYLYYSGNLYDKKIFLNQDKDTMVNIYGEDTFKAQKEKLDEVFENEVYSKRLQINPTDPNQQLVLLPKSEFSKSFFIENLEDESELKAKPYGDNQETRKKGIVGQPNWGYTGSRAYGWDLQKYEKMNLVDAFQYWLRYAGGSKQIKKNISWLDIVDFYILKKQYNEKRDENRTAYARKKALAKQEGDRLFLFFLKTQLKKEDQLKLETKWNREFNGYIEPDYDKVPVAFEYSKKFHGDEMDIRWEKRESIAYMMTHGSGCIAYQVGLGKTLCAIFTIKQYLEAGYCKRPFLVVPNQTYRQWMSEIKSLMPDILINDLYNLGKDYEEQLQGADGKIDQVPKGSFSLMTYEGFVRMGFNEQTADRMEQRLYDILSQGEAPEGKKGDKERERFREKLQELIGRGQAKGLIDIENLGFDFMLVDEAHALKKVFTYIKSKGGAKAEYEIQAGQPSTRALKGFMFSQYIQSLNNRNGNVMLLTATPFTNSPLEVFSMFALIDYSKLEDTNMGNLKDFFDNYVMTSYEIVITAKMRPERREIFKGWANLQALQRLLFQYMLYKEGDTPDHKGRIVNLSRPNKYVLPRESEIVDGMEIELDESEKVGTAISMTEQQRSYMEEIKEYAGGGGEIIHTGITEADDDEDPEADTTEGLELDEMDMDSDEKAGVKVLKAVNFSRNLALSPYLYVNSGLGKPDYLDYVESSPKLTYVMKCVESVKEYHEKRKEPISGQVIYMDRGKDYFNLVKEYLVKVIGFKDHEVGIIKSGMSGGKKAKERIKNAFNGLEYDEASGTYDYIPDKERIKVVIGSSSIREGMNLQKNSTVLYNCFLDWNPTDNVQIEGRVWRQGNKYKYVRIVIPLMIDSVDIFMFQKLEEKTARINAIWNRGGRMNVIDVREFNPKELKYSLIKDPYIIAEMEVDDMKEDLQDDKSQLINLKETAENIKKEITVIENREDDLQKIVDYWRPKRDKDGNVVKRSLNALINTYEKILDEQTDADGNKISEHPKYNVDRWQNPFKEYGLEIPYSYGWSNEPVEPKITKEYWYSDFRKAVKVLERKTKDFLIPNKIKPTEKDLNLYIEKITNDIKEIEKKVEGIASEDALRERAMSIAQEQAKLKVGNKTPDDRLREFKKLNKLLDEKVVKVDTTEEMFKVVNLDSCPPTNNKGERRIDPEAITLLEECISKLPSTKSLNTDENDIYKPERKDLHEKIIFDLYKNVACLERERPVCILTAGPPGSGKSTFLKRFAPYMTSDQIVKVDADYIRSMLPEYKGWNSNSTHLEAKDIVGQAIKYISTPCRHDVLYDGTMNTPAKYFPLINQLKRYGYKIYIIFLEVPEKVSRERALKRYQNSGRYVPDEVISSFFSHAPDHFLEIKSMVDGWIRVDGLKSRADDIQDAIIEEYGEQIPTDRGYFTGKVIKKEDPQPVKQKLDKVKYKDAIDGLQVLLEMADSEKDRNKYKDAIEGLEIVIDLM